MTPVGSVDREAAVTRDRSRRPGGVLHLVPDHLTTPLLLGALGAVLVFPLALLLTSSLVLATAAAVGVLGAVLMVSDPLIAVLVYVAVEVSQTGAVLQQLGVPSPFVVTQALTIIALAVAYYRGRLELVWSPVLLGAAVLLATRAASLASAYDPAMTLATVASETRDMATLACTFVLLWITRGTSAAVRVCVLVLTLLAGLSAVQEYLLGNSTEFLGFSQVNPPDVGSSSFRHLGPVGDPNFWGRVLLMFLPFALALALAARAVPQRVLWWGSFATLLLGVFLTQSRGAFLAAGVSLVVLLLLSGWRYARWLALTPVLVAVLLTLPGVGTRLSTLGDLATTSEGGGDLSLVLRLSSQEAGLRMFAENPLLGVGAGNYENLTPQFERGLSFATVGELGRPLAPHNTYLEFAAEGGLLGVLGLGIFLGTLTFCGLRAWRAAALRTPAGAAGLERLLASAAMASLAGWAVASIVLHARQFRTLLVLCAIIACLDAARRRGRTRTRVPVLAGQQRFVVPWAGLLVLALAGGAWLAATGGAFRERWRAEAVSVVTSRGGEIGYLDAYHYDLLTRGQVVPTLAAAVARSDSARAALQREDVELQTAVRTSPRSSDVLLQVEGDDRQVVVQSARQLAQAGVAVVDAFELPFELRTVPFDETTASRVSRLRTETVVVAGTLLLLAAGLVWTQLQAHYRLALAAVPPPLAATAAGAGAQASTRARSARS